MGGHFVLEVQDDNIAVFYSKIYTYNRGESNISLAVRGLKAGRTFVRFRSHDGEVLGEIPIQVAEVLAASVGVPPTACPEAATYRTTFALSGGDETLYEPFGGAWWRNGITLVFRRIGADRFEIRSSGAPEGQFFCDVGNAGDGLQFSGERTGSCGVACDDGASEGEDQCASGSV